jgi:transposase-like protein
VLADEHADVLRQVVCWLAEQLMEAEVTAAAGAGYGERSGERTARGNGYRQRAGRPGGVDRAGHSQAVVGVVLSELPGS